MALRSLALLGMTGKILSAVFFRSRHGRKGDATGSVPDFMTVAIKQALHPLRLHGGLCVNGFRRRDDIILKK